MPGKSGDKLLEELGRFVEGMQPAAWGCAPIRAVHPDGVVDYYRDRYMDWSAWVMALPLDDAVIDGLPDTTIKYVLAYHEFNYRLDEMANRFAEFSRGLGVDVVTVPASQRFKEGMYHGGVSHRHVAVAAGLGVIGDSGLILLPGTGPRARFVTVLLDVDVPEPALVEGGCLHCGNCLQECPSGALKEPENGIPVKDVTLCHEQLQVNREKVLAGVYGELEDAEAYRGVCGLCLTACKYR